MNKKIINEFIKKNFFKINEVNSSKKMLLIDRGIAESAIMNSFFILKNLQQNIRLSSLYQKQMKLKF